MTFMTFHHILGTIIPTEFHIFSEGLKPPTRDVLICFDVSKDDPRHGAHTIFVIAACFGSYALAKVCGILAQHLSI